MPRSDGGASPRWSGYVGPSTKIDYLSIQQRSTAKFRQRGVSLTQFCCAFPGLWTIIRSLHAVFAKVANVVPMAFRFVPLLQLATAAERV
jgi:hypothetical protein